MLRTSLSLVGIATRPPVNSHTKIQVFLSELQMRETGRAPKVARFQQRHGCSDQFPLGTLEDRSAHRTEEPPVMLTAMGETRPLLNSSTTGSPMPVASRNKVLPQEAIRLRLVHSDYHQTVGTD
jgi:hypothetical protein